MAKLQSQSEGGSEQVFKHVTHYRSENVKIRQQISTLSHRKLSQRSAVTATIRKVINEPSLFQRSATLTSLRTGFPRSLPWFLERKFWRNGWQQQFCRERVRDGPGEGSRVLQEEQGSQL